MFAEGYALRHSPKVVMVKMAQENQMTETTLNFLKAAVVADIRRLKLIKRRPRAEAKGIAHVLSASHEFLRVARGG